LEEKNSAGCLLKTKWLMKKMLVLIGKFSSAVGVFKRQSAEFFLSKKIRQMKGDQNNKYDIMSKTSGFVQVGFPLSLIDMVKN
jgi:hypothetical protein